MPQIGENAPDFTLPSTSGEDVTLSSLKPKAVVLFFYPRDNTSGCTKEAIGFSELKEAFAAENVEVFGLSKDDMKSHHKFVEKQELTVELLTDADSDVCEAYDVWKEKKMYGKTYMGIERSTFLIDGEGKIAQVWRKVKVPGHVEEVMEAVKAL
ncbi:thioredoxin-dependent thiol peroxidase [Cognatishimia sp.]|uniref:thioredoxin-dependent thiol peroxidase n=1 Tax=Cognatishimia sp. TaxID=2211648 RepID=UPI00351636D5|nr:thioredoxin-dependent thiol peroxidase [Cognatishimia sp.]